MKEETIFTKIVKGEIPCHKVYEDALTLAFLDIHPAQPGHTLVISKKQFEYVWDLPEEDYQSLMTAVQKVSLRLREVMGVKYVGARVFGIDVPHAHVHLVPFNLALEFNAPQDMDKDPDHAALAKIAAELSF